MENLSELFRYLGNFGIGCFKGNPVLYNLNIVIEYLPELGNEVVYLKLDRRDFLNTIRF